MPRLYEPIRLLNEEGSLEDWSFFGITKDDEGYLWMLDRVFGRETKRLTEDRRFTRHGDYSRKNGVYSYGHSSTSDGSLLSESGTEDEKILRLIHMPGYEPLVPLREQFIEQAVLIWRDTSLSREGRQQKIADLRQAFIDAVHGRTDELQRIAEEEKRRAEEEARRQAELQKQRAEAVARAAEEHQKHQAAILQALKDEKELKRKLEETAAREARRVAHESYRNLFTQITEKYSGSDLCRVLRTAVTYLSYPAIENIWTLVRLGVLTRRESESALMARQRDGEYRFTWDRNHREVRKLLDDWTQNHISDLVSEVERVIPIAALRSGLEAYEDLYV